MSGEFSSRFSSYIRFFNGQGDSSPACQRAHAMERSRKSTSWTRRSIAVRPPERAHLFGHCFFAPHCLTSIALALRDQEQLSRSGAQQAALRILRQCLVARILPLMAAVHITRTSRPSVVLQFMPDCSMTGVALSRSVSATLASTTTGTSLAMELLRGAWSTGTPCLARV